MSTNFLGVKEKGSPKDAKAQRKTQSSRFFFAAFFASLRLCVRFFFGAVKKQTLIHTLIYGLCGGILIVVLRVIEFRFLIVEHSIEIYGGLIAALFAGLGIWLGLKLTKKKEVLVVREVPVTQPFALNEQRL